MHFLCIVPDMPNLKASKKALSSSKNKQVYNQRVKTQMKKAVKAVRDLAEAGQTDEAKQKMPEAYKRIDKAAKRNIIKANTASRKKSRLEKLVQRSRA